MPRRTRGRSPGVWDNDNYKTISEGIMNPNRTDNPEKIEFRDNKLREYKWRRGARTDHLRYDDDERKSNYVPDRKKESLNQTKEEIRKAWKKTK